MYSLSILFLHEMFTAPLLKATVGGEAFLRAVPLIHVHEREGNFHALIVREVLASQKKAHFSIAFRQ
jgi:hypothetical protein